MLTSIAAIKTKAETTGKLPPLTAKAKATIAAEARVLAFEALRDAGFDARLVEVDVYKSSHRLGLPRPAVSYVDYTGDKAAHRKAAERLKAAGVSVSFAKVEQGNGFTSRSIELFYPFV